MNHQQDDIQRSLQEARAEQDAVVEAAYVIMMPRWLGVGPKHPVYNVQAPIDGQERYVNPCVVGWDFAHDKVRTECVSPQEDREEGSPQMGTEHTAENDDVVIETFYSVF